VHSLLEGVDVASSSSDCGFESASLLVDVLRVRGEGVRLVVVGGGLAKGA
jgi:hypothetical protein